MLKLPGTKRNGSRMADQFQAIPNAIILMNSFPKLRRLIGQGITGHFRTHIFAKIPFIRAFEQKHSRIHEDGSAAKVVRGRDPASGQEYHIQRTLFRISQKNGSAYSRMPPWNESCLGACTNTEGRDTCLYVSAETNALTDIALPCAVLGELGAGSKRSWLQLDEGRERSPRADLHIEFCDLDRQLWDLMDSATFKVIESLVASRQDVVYWHESDQNWYERRPPSMQRRSRGTCS